MTETIKKKKEIIVQIHTDFSGKKQCLTCQFFFNFFLKKKIECMTETKQTPIGGTVLGLCFFFFKTDSYLLFFLLFKLNMTEIPFHA